MVAGSTLVAAVEGGYRCVGIEKTDEYYDIAKQRLKKLI